MRIHEAETAIPRHVTSVGKPVACLGDDAIVLRTGVARQKIGGKTDIGLHLSLMPRLPPQNNSFGEIARHALPLCVHRAQLKLGVGYTLVRQWPQQRNRRREILTLVSGGGIVQGFGSRDAEEAHRQQPAGKGE